MTKATRQIPQTILMLMLRNAIDVQINFIKDKKTNRYNVDFVIDGGTESRLATDGFKLRKVKHIDEVMSILRRCVTKLASVQMIIQDTQDMNRKPPSQEEKDEEILKFAAWSIVAQEKTTKLLVDRLKIFQEWTEGDSKTARLAAIDGELSAAQAVIDLAAGTLPE